MKQTEQMERSEQVEPDEQLEQVAQVERVEWIGHNEYIERIDTFPMIHRLKAPYGDANGYKEYRTCFLFRITTRSGVEGWGECIDWLPTLEQGFRQRIIPFLLGKPVLDRMQLVKTVEKWHLRAAAGVSMALTEIAAKMGGFSVTELWGGKWREQVPVYASFQSYTDREDWSDESLRLVEKAVDAGYGMVKVKTGGKPFMEDEAHIVRILRTLEGKGRVAVDANQSYDVAEAERWLRVFTRWDNILWFEEPLPLDQTAGYRMLRETLPVPIAGGENLAGGSAFLPLLRENAVDIIQPDVMHVKGIDEYRSILELGRYFGIRVSPHAYDGVLSRFYAILAQSCLSPWSKMKEADIEPVEWDVMENPFNRLILLSPEAGMVRLPDGPGLGVELDLEMMEAFRWDGTPYA